MRILIAEDDPIGRRLLASTLQKWGYEVIVAVDGEEAWQVFQTAEPPRLAILDWMMPGLDGPAICRQVRALPGGERAYLILLTAKGTKEDVIAGLREGADDFMTKPFDPGELKARLKVGERIIALQQSLGDKVRELSEALEQVQMLQGLLPICSYCKKIREDKNYWVQVESYLSRHAPVRFSHGICPECFEKEVKPQLDKLKSAKMAAKASS